MLNKRIATGLMSIAGAFAIAGGATFAYFTDTETSTGNTFATGTLNISLVDQNKNSEFSAESIIKGWAPGEDAEVNFDVRNTGSLPVHIRGNAFGTWGEEVLDNANVVKVTKVERWNGSAWETLRSNSNGIVGDFYYSPNGGNANHYVVEPNSRAQLRLTVKLDGSANNDFQGKTFTSTLQVEAKQTTNGATWTP